MGEGGMGHMTKVIVTEIVGAMVILLLLVIFRPLIIGSVATSQQAYTYHYTNSTGGDQTSTVTPTSTLTVTQADSLYSIVFFIVVIVALVVLLLTATGKIHF
jgi:hypothetical protein